MALATVLVNQRLPIVLVPGMHKLQMPLEWATSKSLYIFLSLVVEIQRRAAVNFP
jgi:hypothetical protein